MRLRRDVIFAPFEHRNAAGKDREHRTPQWFDLIWDLIFVAMVAKWGLSYEHMHLDYSYRAVRDIFCLFSPVFSTWWMMAVYSNHFSQTDFVDVLVYFGSTLTMVVMCLNISYCQEQYSCIVFTSTMFVSRIIFSLGYARVWYLSSGKLSRFARFWCIYTFVTGILWIINTSLRPDESGADHNPFAWSPKNFFWVAFYWLPMLLDFPGMLLVELFPYYEHSIRIPMNLGLMIERLGCFVVLSLGEVMVAASKAEVTSEDTSDVEKMIIISCRSAMLAVLGLNLKVLYFDIAHSQLESNHAVYGAPWKRFLFFLFHFPIVSCIPLMAASFVEQVVYHHLIVKARVIGTVNLVVVLLCIHAIEYLNSGPTVANSADVQMDKVEGVEVDQLRVSMAHSDHGDHGDPGDHANGDAARHHDEAPLPGSDYFSLPTRTIVLVFFVPVVIGVSTVSEASLSGDKFFLFISLMLTALTAFCYFSTRVREFSPASGDDVTAQSREVDIN